MERQYSWSDNKQIKFRKMLNYERNLRPFDSNNIPWKYYAVGHNSLTSTMDNDNVSRDTDRSSDESLLIPTTSS